MDDSSQKNQEHLDTMLINACQMGSCDRAKEYLDKGANPNALDFMGKESALMIAAGNGPLKLVKLLVDRGADPCLIVNSENALTAACLADKPSVAKYLLQQTPKPSFACVGDLTLIALCADRAYGDIVKLLIENGADVNALSHDATPLMVSINDESITRLLLNAGADPNISSSNGTTALQLASRGGYYVTAKMLIESGANVNSSNGCNTPLLAALQGRHAEIAELLLDSGADVNVTSSYDAHTNATPSYYAYQHESCWRLLEKISRLGCPPHESIQDNHEVWTKLNAIYLATHLKNRSRKNDENNEHSIGL